MNNVPKPYEAATEHCRMYFDDQLSFEAKAARLEVTYRELKCLRQLEKALNTSDRRLHAVIQAEFLRRRKFIESLWEAKEAVSNWRQPLFIVIQNETS